MIDMRDGLGEQHAHVIVVERIHDAPALTFADDEPEMTQYPQLLRDGGLLHLDLPGQFGDRAWPGTQATEDPDTARGG